MLYQVEFIEAMDRDDLSSKINSFFIKKQEGIDELVEIRFGEKYKDTPEYSGNFPYAEIILKANPAFLLPEETE